MKPNHHSDRHTAKGNDNMRTPTFYGAGFNLPGYLPKSAPFITTSHESAVEYLQDELNRTANHTADLDVEDEQTDRTLADVDAALIALESLPTGADFYALVNLSRHTDFAFWIRRIPPSDVEVCGWCGTIRMPDDLACYACGSPIVVTADEYPWP